PRLLPSRRRGIRRRARQLRPRDAGEAPRAARRGRSARLRLRREERQAAPPGDRRPRRLRGRGVVEATSGEAPVLDPVGRHQRVHQRGHRRRLLGEGLPDVARDSAGGGRAGGLGAGDVADCAEAGDLARDQRGCPLPRQHARRLPCVVHRPPRLRPVPGGVHDLAGSRRSRPHRREARAGDAGRDRARSPEAAGGRARPPRASAGARAPARGRRGVARRHPSFEGRRPSAQADTGRVMRHLASDRRAGFALTALTGAFGVLAIGYCFDSAGAVRHVLNVGVYDNVVFCAGLLCVARGVLKPSDRAAWVIAGAAGDTVWTHTIAGDPNPPYPSYADVGYLCFYPAAYGSIVLLLSERIDRLRSILWLDGVIGGLAVSAAGTAVVFQAVLEVVHGSRAAVATNLAYPLADLTLIALVVWGLSIAGWRPGRAWGLIAAGLVIFSVSDCLYLSETATGRYTDGSPTDLGWVAGSLLLAWAAWQPPERLGVKLVGGRALFAAPVTFAFLSLGVLVYDHVHPVNTLALVLAALAIVFVIVRMALTFNENMQLLAGFRAEAGTDLLTGLANRRRLLDDSRPRSRRRAARCCSRSST